MSREEIVAQTLVDLADTLVDEFDVVDLLTLLSDRCVEVFDVAAAGVMLVSPGGELRVVASSSDKMHILELFEEQSEDGPCPDCYRSGRPVLSDDLSTETGRWPHFAPEALAAGFQSAHALPMHLRSLTLGALNLFRTEKGLIGEADVLTAQAFADVATIAIIQQSAVLDARVVQENLNRVLNGRAIIEQAKGVLSGRHGLAMDLAFVRLRDHAHSHGLGLVETMKWSDEGSLATEQLAEVRDRRARGTRRRRSR